MFLWCLDKDVLWEMWFKNKINFGWLQYLWEKFVHGVCLKGSYFDVSWTVSGKEFTTVCFERNLRKLPCENIVLFGIKMTKCMAGEVLSWITATCDCALCPHWNSQITDSPIFSLNSNCLIPNWWLCTWEQMNSSIEQPFYSQNFFHDNRMRSIKRNPRWWCWWAEISVAL